MIAFVFRYYSDFVKVLKTKTVFCFLAFLLIFSAKSFAGTTYIWNSVAGGNWTTNSNWLPNTGYPGSSGTTDVAIINTSNITVTLASTITIARLKTSNFGVSGVTISVSSGSTLNINSGISTSQPSSLTDSFIFAGAGATKIGGTISAAFHSSFSISLGGTVYFTANAIFDESTGNPHGILTNNGTLNILAGCAIKFGDFASLVNTGTIHSYSSTYTLSGSGSPAAAVTNSGTFIDHGSTFNITGQNANLTNSGASANFHGRGTTISTSGGNTSISITNSNAAAVFTLDSASVVNLGNFQGALTNSGIFFAGTSNSSCTINLTAQSTSVTNTGTFDLGSTSIIYPTGVTTSVINTSPGVFTLQSDANGSAAIGALSSTAVCTGTFNVERYFTGGSGYRGYRLVSSPVYAGTINSNNVFSINYLQTYTYLTGSAGGGFDKTGNPTLYLYREDQVPSNATFISGNFEGISAINNSPAYTYSVTGAGTAGTFNLPVGNGVMFFFRGNRASATVAAETTLGYIPVTVTTTTAGTLNTGQVVVHDWYTPASANLAYTGAGDGTNSVVRGFNLVGNPYPSSIDWEQYNTASTTAGIYANNVSNTIYEFNPKTQNYDTYQVGGSFTNHGTNTVVSGEGFFVQAVNSTSPQLIFNETAKTADQNTGLDLFMVNRSSLAALNNINDQHLRLQLALDSVNTDDIFIGFNEGAKNEYVFNEDAVYKQGSGKVSLSSFSADGMPLAINKLPLPKSNTTVIPIRANAYNYGTYQLNMIDVKGLPAIYEVWLMDRFNKDSVDMRHNSSYTFDMTPDTNSYGAGRFQLVIRQNPALMIHLLSFTGAKAPNGAELTWKTENEENYTNFTLERSTDGGVTFDALGGFASSAAGAYSFTDKSPPASADMYRLKIEDLNGTITYSNVVTLMYANTTNTIAGNISIYPNPASTVINLAINPTGVSSSAGDLSVPHSVNSTTGPNQTTGSQSYTIKIVNITGSVIKTATSSSTSWQANISDVSPGVYIIQVNDNSNDSVVGRSAFVKL